MLRENSVVRLLRLVVLTCGYAAGYLAVVALVYGMAWLAGLT